MPAGVCSIIPLGITLTPPDNMHIRVTEAASDRLLNHVAVDKEIVQCDASGRCGIVLRNFGNDEYSVQRGDAVTQILSHKPDTSVCIRIDDVDEDVEVAVGSPIADDDDEEQLPLASASKAPKGPKANPHTSGPKFNVPTPKQGARP